MKTEKPYFLTSPDWYTFDISQGKYILTDAAPQEAKASYIAFYANYYEDKNRTEFGIGKDPDTGKELYLNADGVILREAAPTDYKRIAYEIDY